MCLDKTLVRNAVKRETIKLIQFQQSASQILKKTGNTQAKQEDPTRSKVNISDSKWQDARGNVRIAETDSDKATALEEFFSSVYTIEDDREFDDLPSRLNKNKTPIPGLDQLHPRVVRMS